MKGIDIYKYSRCWLLLFFVCCREKKNGFNDWKMWRFVDGGYLAHYRKRTRVDYMGCLNWWSRIFLLYFPIVIMLRNMWKYWQHRFVLYIHLFSTFLYVMHVYFKMYSRTFLRYIYRFKFFNYNSLCGVVSCNWNIYASIVEAQVPL